MTDQGSVSVRYWSLLFALAAIFSVGVFIYAPFSAEWWLPAGPDASVGHLHSVSSAGKQIDSLFVIILWITGIVFIGTQVALVYSTYFYADQGQGEGARKASYFHGSQRLEVIWTIIPSAILVFIALYQMGTWSSVKFRSAAPKVQPVATVTARQFQWVMRYPGPDGKINTVDDLHVVNDLHFVKGKPALIYLSSTDVLHSFFLPALRIKQDAVPGLTIPVWFDSDQEGQYELACAELCGWGHGEMKGRVFVHKTQQEFDEWMKSALREQARDQVAAVDTGSQGR
jgi:cytochrome c oxidase subunit 2